VRDGWFLIEGVKSGGFSSTFSRVTVTLIFTRCVARSRSGAWPSTFGKRTHVDRQLALGRNELSTGNEKLSLDALKSHIKKPGEQKLISNLPVTLAAIQASSSAKARRCATHVL
jgi:hypothetical protein